MSNPSPPSGVTPEPQAHSAGTSRRWLFANAELDEASLQLTVGGRLVEVGPKPLGVLQLLLERPGEVVTKDELIDRLWQGITDDWNVTRTLTRLRVALQDKDHSLIDTVHKFGYRLTAPVTMKLVGKPTPKLGLTVGDRLPLRPQWHLIERLGDGGQGELWLIANKETQEKRACKFALDGGILSSLKREVTLNRWLTVNLPEQASAFVRVLDSNLQQAPFYIEMEYLPAGSLAQWADRQGGCAQVPLAVRLELAAQIAEALGHAHSMQVFHKDLKPGNVLIDIVPPATETEGGESPIPIASMGSVRIKLCDFGGGDLLDRNRLADGGVAPLGFTVAGFDEAAGGTPMYLAPEVLSGQPYSMQADLYSLGVLLYQLIAADLNKALAPGWERGIADELLREDIGELVDGDPNHRLRDAAEAARRLRTLDLRREERAQQRQKELDHERLRRDLESFRARRRWWLGVASVVGAFLLVVLVLWLEADKARDEALTQKRRAEVEAANADAVNEFLLQDLLGQASPIASGRAELKVTDVLDDASRTAGARFVKRPDHERAVRLAVGRAYLQLGNFSDAERQLHAALGLTPDSEPQQRAEITYDLSTTVRYLNRIPEARDLLAKAVADGNEETRLMAASTLAFYKSMLDSDHATAVSELLALRPGFEALPDPQRLDWLLEALASVYSANGQYKESVQAAREQSARIRNRYGQDDPRDINARSTLGIALVWAEQADEGMQVLADVLPRARTVLGENHLNSLVAARYLAQAYENLRRYKEALALLEPTYDKLRTHYGAEHYETLTALSMLGQILGSLGDFDRQSSLLEEGLRLHQVKFGESHQETLNFAHNLAMAYVDRGAYAKAEALQASTLELARKSIPDVWLTGTIAAARAECLGRLHRFDESEALFEEAIQHLTRTLGKDHSRVATAIDNRDAMRRQWTSRGKASPLAPRRDTDRSSRSDAPV